MPKLQILKPYILRDLAKIDLVGEVWQATGPAAAFRLATGSGDLLKGWLAVSVAVPEPDGGFVVPSFSVDSGEGWRPIQTTLLWLAPGRCTTMFHVPSDAIGLSMTPPVPMGPFRLNTILARPLSRVLASTKLSEHLARHWSRQPREAIKSTRRIRNAWRASGRTGVRDVLRETLLTISSGVTAASTPQLDRYQRWIIENEPYASSPPPYRSVSLLIPVTDAEPYALGATLASLEPQSEVTWECWVGFAPGLDVAVLGDLDTRLPGAIRGVVLAGAERGSMLAALSSKADGDLLLVLDPGDRLAPGALAALASVGDADVVYGDEDQLGTTNYRHSPLLKPAWSSELLTAYNYFGRPTALQRDAVSRAGDFIPGLGAGSEWDLHLRLAQATTKIVHIPSVLCHRPNKAMTDRVDADSTEAANLRHILAEYWERHGLTAQVVTNPDGTHHATWPIAKPPLVSIIIANRDDARQIEQCLERIRHHTNYPSIEVVIVDDDSTDPETCTLYDRLKAAEKLQVVHPRIPANSAAARNAGARAAHGSLLLFLNNILAPQDTDWLEEFVRFTLRPGVGIVGPLLLDSAGRVQHAGISIGTNACNPLFQSARETERGPFGSPSVPRTVSAVTGACLMARRDVFEQVGGFDESYISGYSDIAFCLAAQAAGWRVVYAPSISLIQHGEGSQNKRILPEDAAHLAHDIRRNGYQFDPYFHPALDANSSIPRVRIGGEPSNATRLRDDWQGRFGAYLKTPTPLDLHDDAAIAEAVGLPTTELFWPAILPTSIKDRWDAARWCLGLLRRRPDLHQRFPDALTAGRDGTFARWIADDGARQFALPYTAVTLILDALGANISARARQVVLIEAGPADGMTLAFLPPGRARLLAFLLPRRNERFRLEEIWWLALECAENPVREVSVSYRFNVVWQTLFPDGLTVFGRDRMAAWFRATYATDSSWTDPALWPETLSAAEQIRIAWNSRRHWQSCHPMPFTTTSAANALLNFLARPEAGLSKASLTWLETQSKEALAMALVRPGLNIIGHLCYPSGLRTSTLSIAEGLRSAGYDVPMRDVPVEAMFDLPRHSTFDRLEVYDTTLIHIQPHPYFNQAYLRSGLLPRKRRTRRIGYWYWELDTAPADWGDAVADVDEVWAATRFVGDAVRARFDVPVFELMPGVELAPFQQRSPAYYDIPAGVFTFLFVFHMGSVMERKNPLGLIRAFRQAFGPTEPVMLVLKTSYGDRLPALTGELHSAAAACHGKVKIIDRVFTTDETISLMDACDAYISLHRSEGLGLTMAEAMLLAKPVIATRYSGNIDFMNDQNSLLVDYELVEIDKAAPPYEVGAKWASPSEAHAASLMRRVYEDRTFAAALGMKAQTELKTTLSMAAAGRRMADHLAAEHHMP